jgi:hypothetical protein
MRRALLLFIAFVYLSTVTEVHELFKVTNLIAHYLQHREQDSTLSFTDFIALHYDEHSEHACSAEHTDELPFKSHPFSIAWFNLIAPIPTPAIKHGISFCAEAFNPEAYYRCIIASERESSIWQPPRLVA